MRAYRVAMELRKRSSRRLLGLVAALSWIAVLVVPLGAAEKPSADEQAAKRIAECAQQAFEADDFDEALVQWRLICAEYHDTLPYATAQYRIGQLFHRQQQYQQAIVEYDKLAARDDLQDDLGNHQHRALVKSAACFRALKNYDEELKCLLLVRDKHPFRIWLCGVGEGWRPSVLEDRIVACLMHLGRQEEALAKCLTDLQCGPRLGQFRARLLAKFYHSADQVGDLTALLDKMDGEQLAALKKIEAYRDLSAERLQPQLRTRDVRTYMRIEELFARGDLNALVEITHQSPVHWSRHIGSPRSEMSEYYLAQLELASPGKAAADALAASGAKGLSAIKRQAENHSWLFYAAGRCTAPETTAWLKEYAAEQPGFANFALAQRGESGTMALRQLARNEEDFVRHVAQKWLDRTDDPLRPFTKWPKVKPGTLPKRFP